jgi:hypothetical protein
MCASCKASAEPGEKFCGVCGTAFSPATSAPPAASPAAYTPRHLAEKILGSRSPLEGERKQVTVLFADVKGSMELAEQLDPEEWSRMMGRFFQILSDGVERFEGFVDKFTGDGIMALFGAPIAHEDHAQRACWAALGLVALGWTLVECTEWSAAVTAGEESLAILRQENRAVFVEFHALEVAARAHLGAGDPGRARAATRELLDLCARCPDVRTPRVPAYRAAAHVLLCTDGADSPEVPRLLDEAEALALEIGYRPELARIHAERAELARRRARCAARGREGTTALGRDGRDGAGGAAGEGDGGRRRCVVRILDQRVAAGCSPGGGAPRADEFPADRVVFTGCIPAGASEIIAVDGPEASSAASPLRRLGTGRGNGQVERAAVAEAHRTEIPDIARREADHPQLLGEGDDAGVHESQVERRVGGIDVERARELRLGRRRVEKGAAPNVRDQGSHGPPRAAQEVVHLGEHESRNVAGASGIDRGAKRAMVRRGGDEIVEQCPRIADDCRGHHRSTVRNSSRSSPRCRSRRTTPADRGFGWGRYCSRARRSCARMNSERETPCARATASRSWSVCASRMMVVTRLRAESAI